MGSCGVYWNWAVSLIYLNSSKKAKCATPKKPEAPGSSLVFYKPPLCVVSSFCPRFISPVLPWEGGGAISPQGIKADISPTRIKDKRPEYLAARPRGGWLFGPEISARRSIVQSDPNHPDLPLRVSYFCFVIRPHDSPKPHRSRVSTNQY